MRKNLLVLTLLPLSALAQENLETIEVKDASFSGFWEENKETKIFSGKKNTVTSLKEIPQLQTNNYRQATSQTPGLLISEVPNESLAAITYRGLGDPHESYNLLLLQDGIPVTTDMYGYPAHYYSPALPMMDKVQFIRGGASLLYGPQPGGVLNYISRPLTKGQRLEGHVGLTGGSYNLLTTNNALYGSTGNNAWGIEYYRRQGNGPQRNNSDFEADYVQIRNHHFAGKNKYKVAFNGYNSDHGEPGGFAKNPGTGANVFGDNLREATKKHDRLKVSRAQLQGGVEHRIDETSELHVNLWADAYNRYSKRQKGGGFGTFPTGANENKNDIVEQKFYSFNGEVRYLKNYQALGNEHTLSAGYMSYNLISPLVSETGAAPDANHGTVDKRNERKTTTNSFFVENRFAIGNLMITPGMRVENIRQEVEEKKGNQRQIDNTENVPLFGLGLAWHLTDNSQVYANASEAYKPFTYTDTLPNAANETMAGDLEAAKTYNYEVGYRGQTKLLNWDVSAFMIRFENKIGTVATGGGQSQIQNTGASTHKGFDLAGEFKLAEMFDRLKPVGDFNFYANLAVLDARYTWGPQRDKTPQYAPKTITRAGVIYSKENKFKTALMGTMVSRHYGNDNNDANFEIPYYMVWDLTADWSFTENWMFSAGINNLLDREYYSRVRSDGIHWALDRNYYAGLTYKF